MISRIKIENYRSIESLEFSPTQLCSLIGPNNAGKSNILNALDIMLGETYPTDRAFTRNDFYNRETDRTICIEVEFSIPLKNTHLTNINRGKGYCQTKILRLTHTQKQDEYFKHKFLALDDNETYYANDDVRKQVQFVYIPADRNLEKQLTISQWTMLGKILKKIDDEFRNGPKGEDGLSDNERLLRERMEEVLGVLKIPQFDEFENSLKSCIKEQTQDFFKDFSLSLDVYDPLYYYKTIQLIAREFEKEFNVTELGSGLQNLILLSIFRTYAKIMKSRSVIAIEEPEIYLHPHAQRNLYQVLRRLCESTIDENTGEVTDEGSQIFYATHSPLFVSLQNSEEIFLVKRSADGKTIVLPKNIQIEPDEKDELKLLTQFNQERNELLFARKVMIVEGQTEKNAFPFAFKKKIDPDTKSISIIEVGGKGNIPFFIKVLTSLGIQWCAVFDTDSDKILTNDEEQALQQKFSRLNDNSPEARGIYKMLTGHRDTLMKNENVYRAAIDYKDRLFPLDPNFEIVCGLPAQKKEEWKKIKQAIERFSSYQDFNDIPIPIKSAIEFLLKCPDSDWVD